MGKFIEKYSEHCNKLKTMLYNELICSHFSEHEYVEYNPGDELAQEVFEPMFNSIIGLTLNKTEQILKEHVASCLSYYGIGSYDSIDKIIPKLIKNRSILQQAFQATKAARAVESNGSNQRQKELSDELDEYLRIGEELEKQKNMKK